ncbi:hypothetical protein BAL199_29240 [alpha proteobacterium BAL199]|nr:hypothetical protein BAL199_29240 [alpha proteobacterium BAL199]
MERWSSEIEGTRFGTLSLEDGTVVKDFLYEAIAGASVRDITVFCGRQAYVALPDKPF